MELAQSSLHHRVSRVALRAADPRGAAVAKVAKLKLPRGHFTLLFSAKLNLYFEQGITTKGLLWNSYRIACHENNVVV
jgi:hypothetical protein